MLFDKFLGLVEKHIPEYTHVAENAKLFVMDITPHEFLPKVTPEWFDESVFALPFQITAVEDKASLLIVCDFKKDVVGLKQKRKVIEVMYNKTSSDHFSDPTSLKAEFDVFRSLEDFYVIIESEVENVKMENTKVGGVVSFVKSYIIDKHGNISKITNKDIPHESSYQMIKTIGKNVFSVFEELVMLSHPKYFVVEETPVKIKIKGKKFPRTHERPLYTIITANDFRKRVRIETLSSESRNSPIPHERRRHLRQLRKESGYKEDRVVVVTATWIGESEKIFKNKRYRVIL